MPDYIETLTSDCRKIINNLEANPDRERLVEAIDHLEQANKMLGSQAMAAPALAEAVIRLKKIIGKALEELDIASDDYPNRARRVLAQALLE